MKYVTSSDHVKCFLSDWLDGFLTDGTLPQTTGYRPYGSDLRPSVPRRGLQGDAAGSPAIRAALAGTAHAEGEVTVGGTVEVIGGTSDHDEGQEGFDRGLFSRINVGYSNTLDNGLEINGQINYLVNQRNVSPDRVNYAPDVLYLSVGGGFGTVTMGSHAMVACAVQPRVIAMVPGGVNATWYRHFAHLWGSVSNVVFTHTTYCGTPTAISYTTPSMGGISAMVSYAPNMSADQTSSLENLSAADYDDAIKDYVAVGGKFSSDMGDMSINVGGSYQTAADDKLEATAIGATIGMGGATVGFSWYDNGDRSGAAYGSGTSGWNIGAKYALGAITPGITYSSLEMEDGGAGKPSTEETAIVIGATYAVGGGLSVFAEYMGLEVQEAGKAAEDETVLMSGVTLGF